MYCVNCGKQVDGTIPICQDCALLVLQNSSNIPLSEKVILEAEDFSIKLDSEVARSIDNYINRADSFLHHITTTDPDGILSTTFTDGLLGQSLTFFAQAKQLALKGNE